MRWRREGLASAATTSGDRVVGHRDVLQLPDRSIRWEEILTAGWDEDTSTLTVMLVDPEVVTVELVEPALLLQLVRERVQASVVLSRRTPVTEESSLLVMARRSPSGGEIRFAVEYDAELDPDDPQVQRIADEAVRAARGELGL